MNNFSNSDIADYYNQTLNHYKRWWHLDDSLAVHYGFWEKGTRTFNQALENTNRYLMQTAGVQPGERILDAGCGVGGSCFYLARQKNAKITGITLSRKQLEYAQKKSIELKMGNLVEFKQEDYSQTSFNDGTFNLIWAIESITSANDKLKFAREAWRVLKPGGRIIIADYFKSREKQQDSGLLEKWRQNWSMAPFLSLSEYVPLFETAGFRLTVQHDVTSLIYRTSKRMYYASLAGALPSATYNLFHQTSRFAKNHYKAGFYQYKALKNDLWKYRVLLFKKEG